MDEALFPMAELSGQWRITPNTVSRRLAYLGIKPIRKGNFRFITEDQMNTANSFHHHLLQGKPMNSFCAKEQQNNSHRISKALRYEILERDGFACKACGATNCLEIDHIVPKSKGGQTIKTNLQVLCSDCNKGKGTSSPFSDQEDGISIKELEARWSVSRNTVKKWAEILEVKLIRVSSTLTIWPADKIAVGDELCSYILTHSTTQGFYACKNTMQFNIRLDRDLVERFKACAYSRGLILGIDQSQSVNRAMRQAMRWYIETLPE